MVCPTPQTSTRLRPFSKRWPRPLGLVWTPSEPLSSRRRNNSKSRSRHGQTRPRPSESSTRRSCAHLLAFLFSIPKPNWIMLAATVVLFVALTLWELRAKYPFVDMRLLVRNGALTRTYLRYALVALCVYIVLYGLTQWLEAGRGMSALGAGLLLLPTSLISGVVVAPISRRNLVRGPVIVGALASLVGSAGVLFLTSDTKIVWIAAITLLFGVALGTTASGNQIALYTQAPPEQLGVASGLFRTFGYVGSIAASAITGIVFHTSGTYGPSG